MLATKVTPAALIACRSQGASSQASGGSRSCSEAARSTSASDADAGQLAGAADRGHRIVVLEQIARRRRQAREVVHVVAADDDQHGAALAFRPDAADEGREGQVDGQAGSGSEAVLHGGSGTGGRRGPCRRPAGGRSSHYRSSGRCLRGGNPFARGRRLRFCCILCPAGAPLAPPAREPESPRASADADEVAPPDRLPCPYPSRPGSAVPGDRARRDRPARGRHAARAVLGVERQPLRRAGGVPARRSGRRLPALPPPFLRPGILAHRPLRPARRGTLDALRRTRRQHDLAPRRRHGAPARALGVDRWLLFGGSWGSTLALAYAQAYPERCLGLVLRGIFLARPAEIEWFMEGMRVVFPEAWREFAEFLPRAGTGRPPRQLLPAAERPRSGRPPARGAGLGPLRGRLRRAAAGRAPAAGRRRSRSRRWPSRGSRRTTSSTAPSLPTTNCCSRSTASVTCRARSSRDATTSSARRSPPTRWRARGPKPSTSSSPTPATRSASRASRASWSRPW